MTLIRRFVRLVALVALLLGGLLVVVLLFPRLNRHARQRTVAAWSRLLLRACGVQLEEVLLPGATPLHALNGRILFVSNHINWLDIFLINALAPAHFVAKSEIRSWPLLGTLCARTGTIFVERGRRHAVREVLHTMEHELEEGGRIAVFPEGTTGVGATLLPFHANLLQAAVRAEAPVVPVLLQYRDLQNQTNERRPSEAVTFVGDMTIAASLWKILGCAKIFAQVHVFEALGYEAGRSRHDLSELAHARMQSHLLRLHAYE
jgi:1-acyl-sn-glycerol-3-phosphate acyltransferase